MVSKAERLTNLVSYLLDVERPVTLREIVSKVAGYPDGFDSARTQFIRDRDELEAEGVVIELSGSHNEDAYRIDPKTHYLPDLGLTEAETLALRLAAEAVRIEGEDADEALLKLGTFGAEGTAVIALPSEARLPPLYQAARRRSRVRFRYDGVDRDIEPWGLLCRDGFWYVPSFDRTRDAQRTFRVDRIEGTVEVSAVRGEFEPPASFDPERDIPSHAFELAPDEPRQAVVHVDNVYARRVVDDLGDGVVTERRDDGSIVVTLAVRNPGGFRSWLFGMLDHATVLGPPEMVDGVRSWLTAMAARG